MCEVVSCASLERYKLRVNQVEVHISMARNKLQKELLKDGVIPRNEYGLWSQTNLGLKSTFPEHDNFTDLKFNSPTRKQEPPDPSTSLGHYREDSINKQESAWRRAGHTVGACGLLFLKPSLIHSFGITKNSRKTKLQGKRASHPTTHSVS